MKYLLLPLILSLSLLAGCAQQNMKSNVVPQPSHPLPATSYQEPSVINDATPSITAEGENHHDADAQPQKPAINAWQKIAESPGFSREIDNAQIEKYRDWYTGRQRYFDRLGARAQLYMAYIIEELENNNLPLELALLPFIESAYNPFAYSPSGAAGLWQFIRPTGDHLGLKRNQWYDGRRDIISSTDAAIRYLKYLNKRFNNDWLLTLAAYNAGEGAVNKAIRKNLRIGKASDFWGLELPPETRAYIPKLVALSQVTASPADYQLILPDIPTEVHFEVIELPQQIDLYQVSLMAEMSLDDIYRLNPGCQQSTTPPEGPHRLLIPKHKTAGFSSRLSDVPKDTWLKVHEYKVQSGDNLSEIAQRHGVRSQWLMAKNNMISSQIQVGQTLKIPSTTGTYVPNFVRPTQYYRVRRGDSLWKIARAYQVKTHNLARWNRLKVKAPLKVGKRLIIRAPTPKGTQDPVNYEIKQGDSLFMISKQFNVSISDIVRWNKLKPQGIIKTGQTLRLFPRS